MMNKATKIVIDLDRLKYPNTGMYNFCYNLYKQFVNNSKFDFYFYKHPKTKLKETNKTISIKKTDSFFLKAKKDIKIWHTTSQLSKRIPVKGVKLVYTLHDLNFLYTDKPQWKKNRELNKIQKNINRADYLTFISNFTKNEIIKHFDITQKKSKVVYNGVSVSEFPEFNTPKVQPKNKFLFTLGVIAPKKNIHTLLCLLEDNKYDLVISGMIADEKYYAELIKKVAVKKLTNRVHFTNTITDEEKYWYLNNCEAFLFPSISEGFGLPPIEAMRLGKPVFLSNLTSLPEIGGKEAFYFTSFEPEHMKSVLKNGFNEFSPAKKEALINWSNKFTWEKAGNDYLEIYQELLLT